MKIIETLKTRWVVWVWNHTPTCAEMARAMSEGFEQPPSAKMRLRMWLHFLICVWCERYHKHLKFLHRAAPHLSEHLDTSSSFSLSQGAKQRIKARLNGAGAN